MYGQTMTFMQLAGTQPGLRDGHLFSLFLMLPLAYVTLALLLFNWYPSQVAYLPSTQSCSHVVRFFRLSEGKRKL